MKKMELEELKTCALEILKYFDRICKKYNLSYSLAYGTLLGAVRHHGFIPWDDDIDIMINRNDYNKLLQIPELQEGRYKLLSVKNEKRFTAPLAKIVDTNTFLRQYTHEELMSLGVFIDIFVLDGVPENKLLRKIHYNLLNIFQRAWNLCERKHDRSSKYKGSIRIILRKILKLIGARNFSLLMDYFSSLYLYEKHSKVTSAMFSVYGRENETFCKQDIIDIIELEFEDNVFCCFSKYDLFLKAWYKDYMKLPPKEQQVPHHEFSAFWSTSIKDVPLNVEPIWVLHICGKMSIGGVQSVLMNFYNHIDRNLIQFAFAVQRDYPYDYDSRIIELGGRVHYLPDMIKEPEKFEVSLRLLLQKHNEYKIVHCHYNHRNWKMLQIAKSENVPIRISHAHAADIKKKISTKLHLGLLSFLIRKNATLLLSCSNASGHYLYDSSGFLIVNNALDLSKFKFDDSIRIKKRKELGIKENALVFGQVGHINKNKNQLFSLAVLASYDKEFKFFIVGNGDYREKIEERIISLDLSKKVEILGVRNDVNELLQAFDVLLFPSFHEGLSVVCMEAQAVGLPIIASANIPDEIEVTTCMKRLPLNKEIWIQEFNKISVNNRHDNTEILSLKGYDIEKETGKLQRLYLSEFEKL